jgi:hypothetical protein
VDASTSQEIHALVERLRQARERLSARVQDLRAVDAELEGLEGERQRHGLLHDACAALEALSELGAAGLFWGEGVALSRGAEQVRLARARLHAFAERVREIEGRRQTLAAAIARAQDDVELLEEDLLEAQREQEQRRLEWIVEREPGALPTRPARMPWTRGGEDDRRFRKALAAALVVSLLLGLLLPRIDLPLPERWEAIEVPERLARLIREERPLPPPPPPVREEPKPAEQEPEPLEEAPLLAEEPAPKAPQQAPKPGAESKGILAFREKFSGFAQNDTPARLGSQARITNPGEVASGRPQRSMVTSQAVGSSGGINLASLSREVAGGGGGGELEGVQVVRATSSIGGGSGPDRPLRGGPGLSRTDEEIQIVFDRHKAALYRLYNRELRRDPTLMGQMVLRIRIEPDGSVSLCELRASDMNAPELAAQVVSRVRTFDFGAKEGIPAITILYPIDFLPAT